MKTTFCCCIKTRLGVLLMAPITCLLAIASTVISIYGLVHFWHDISIWQRIFWCSLSAMTSILALASVYGFVGAIVKSHNSVNVYANAMYSLWISLTASGILSFIFLLKDQEDVIDACIHTERQSDYWCKKVSLIVPPLLKTQAHTVYHLPGIPTIGSSDFCLVGHHCRDGSVPSHNRPSICSSTSRGAKGRNLPKTTRPCPRNAAITILPI
jgi:hypothetical protein